MNLLVVLFPRLLLWTSLWCIIQPCVQSPQKGPSWAGQVHRPDGQTAQKTASLAQPWEEAGLQISWWSIWTVFEFELVWGCILGYCLYKSSKIGHQLGRRRKCRIFLIKRFFWGKTWKLSWRLLQNFESSKKAGSFYQPGDIGGSRNGFN